MSLAVDICTCHVGGHALLWLWHSVTVIGTLQQCSLAQGARDADVRGHQRSPSEDDRSLDDSPSSCGPREPAAAAAAVTAAARASRGAGAADGGAAAAGALLEGWGAAAAGALLDGCGAAAGGLGSCEAAGTPAAPAQLANTSVKPCSPAGAWHAFKECEPPHEAVGAACAPCALTEAPQHCARVPLVLCSISSQTRECDQRAAANAEQQALPSSTIAETKLACHAFVVARPLTAAVAARMVRCHGCTLSRGGLWLLLLRLWLRLRIGRHRGDWCAGSRCCQLWRSGRPCPGRQDVCEPGQAWQGAGGRRRGG